MIIDKKIKRGIIRKERAMRRYNRRKEKYRDKRNKPYGNSTCPYCGGEMMWCDICQVYSSNCCQDWGTCMCS